MVLSKKGTSTLWVLVATVKLYFVIKTSQLMKQTATMTA